MTLWPARATFTLLLGINLASLTCIQKILNWQNHLPDPISHKYLLHCLTTWSQLQPQVSKNAIQEQERSSPERAMIGNSSYPCWIARQNSWGDVLISPGPGGPAGRLGERHSFAVYLHRNFVFTGLAAIGMKFYLCSKVTDQCNRNLKYEIRLCPRPPPPHSVNSNSYRVGSIRSFEVEKKDENGKKINPPLFVFLKIKLICTRT